MHLTLVALSGGVDSAVAALLLRDMGHDVQCLHMTNWEDDDGYCEAAQDFQDARHVSLELGLPLHRVNFAAEYRAQVFEQFLAEHRKGRTPNPDVLCNREIKFGLMRRYAKRLGARLVATGHYARLRRANGTSQLLKGADPAKDQSYFLHAVLQSDLADIVFPLGDLPKSTVRRIARDAGLATAEKKDSTGICFIGERPFGDFLSRYLADEPGRIRDSDGTERGTHRGLAWYTHRSTPRPEDRGQRERQRATLVRRRQGQRAQRADRRAGTRPSTAVPKLARRKRCALDRAPPRPPGPTAPCCAAPPRSVIVRRIRPARSCAREQVSSRYGSTSRSAHRHQASTSCSMTATAASAVRRSIAASSDVASGGASRRLSSSIRKPKALCRDNAYNLHRSPNDPRGHDD